jgi:endonuclease YncB( thermonuclease family)
MQSPKLLMLNLAISLFALILISLSLSADGFGSDIIDGNAIVIDGDTIEIHGKRIRLDPIDAPESRQTCLDATETPYRCGQKSAFALADMIGRGVVSCQPKGRDRYKRIIAVCFRGDTNLNAWMVSQGWAVAFRKYGNDYISQEDEARLARRGMWAGSFDMPWDWRSQNN